MEKFRTFSEFATWLDGLGLFSLQLGLERMFTALSYFNLTKLPFITIHVLGSNGKGSTSSFLAQLALEHGLKTGLYTSPHFVSIRERIRINGKQADPLSLLEYANILASVQDNLNLTYFEFLTILSLLYFKACNVNIAILEAGLGGANDATTAIDSPICCFTPIAMDHVSLIGPTLQNIVLDKAAAIKNDAIVFSAPQFQTVANILRTEAAKKKATLHFVKPISTDYPLGLHGEFQQINAGLATVAFKYAAKLIDCKLDAYKCSLALSKTFLPGRLQKIPAIDDTPVFILDGGHNPHAIQTLSRELKKLNPAKLKTIIYSSFKDKNWRTNIAILMRVAENAKIHIPQMTSERAEDADKIADFCNSINPGRAKSFTGVNALRDAITDSSKQAIAADEYVLICGSLYLLSSFFSLYPRYLEPDYSFDKI